MILYIHLLRGELFEGNSDPNDDDDDEHEKHTPTTIDTEIGIGKPRCKSSTELKSKKRIL